MVKLHLLNYIPIFRNTDALIRRLSIRLVPFFLFDRYIKARFIYRTKLWGGSSEAVLEKL